MTRNESLRAYARALYRAQTDPEFSAARQREAREKFTLILRSLDRPPTHDKKD